MTANHDPLAIGVLQQNLVEVLKRHPWCQPTVLFRGREDCVTDDVGGLLSTRKRTGEERVDANPEDSHATRGRLNPDPPVGGQRAGCVLMVGIRPGILGDSVTDQDQLHRRIVFIGVYPVRPGTWDTRTDAMTTIASASTNSRAALRRIILSAAALGVSTRPTAVAIRL